MDIRRFRPDGGESWEDVYERRASVFMDSVLEEARFLPEGRESHVLAVTHGGFIKEIMNWLRQRDSTVTNSVAVGSYPNSAGNTCVYQFLISASSVRLLTENSVEHIRGAKIPAGWSRADAAIVDCSNIMLSVPLIEVAGKVVPPNTVK